ncbi:putative membrane protein [Sediminihabitans luteus]|uniref:Putative membrane protein n=1 Tax=Sediminihabitans luteus TaxID=1138585 RepID=A0A2M9D150_9CELL|nr:DUF1269 domain-containing protein [Sediminihabitans luteus]PJJ77934.1 putative membrane protein [Sediminihabitans luteus]GII99708.1 membrane protein [Sediminihabitans luteus]
MARFTVWKFDDPEGADVAAGILKRAASEGLVTVVDHVVVSWPEGDGRPSTHHSHDDTVRGTGWGAFWGMLLGALFFLPLVGAAAGAAVGGISKALNGMGITDDQLDAVREQVTPGTSALFLINEVGDPDLLGERFHGVRATLVATNLTDAERDLLLQTFGGGPVR